MSRRVDVQVRGAGMVGRLLATRLQQEGVAVHLVDPHPEKSALSSTLPLVLPTHPEHPHRLEAALGHRRARSLLDFIAWGMSLDPGIKKVPLLWRPTRGEDRELPSSFAAAQRLGLDVQPAPEGYWMMGGLAGPLPCPPIHPQPVKAEVEICCGGAWAIDPFLEERLTPIRQLALLFSGGEEVPPTLSWHASLRFWGGEAGLWASGGREATPHMEVGERHPVPDPRVLRALEQLTRGFFPTLGPILEQRCAIIAESCDGLPMVGPIPGRPRSLVCAGFGMAGYSYARPCVEALVQGLLKGESGILPPELSADRFR